MMMYCEIINAQWCTQDINLMQCEIDYTTCDALKWLTHYDVDRLHK